MAYNYAGKTALLTGGTGSFGRTVAQRLLDTNISEIRIFSRDEAKQDEMRHQISDKRLRFYIGDVRDISSVERCMSGVNFVFHAAALKQVPSCEFFPMEAVKTNVQGSENVIRSATNAGVESVVCLSTDKAVYPVNAMGMTKALMEKVAQSYGLDNPHSSTTISCVRYGNVMHSRGSVIPHFMNQIESSRNITITNPHMSRFMMSLEESVSLVEFAFNSAQQGDLFIKKARACTIGNLAQALLNLFDANNTIEIIGARHAEKLSEALATSEELARAEDMGEYFRIKADNRDLNYGLYTDVGDPTVSSFKDYDSHSVEHMSVSEVESLLLTLPEVRNRLSFPEK